MHFVGVDLGWKRSPPVEDGTAVCVLDRRGKMIRSSLVTRNQEIMEMVSGFPGWVGIDAPLKVPNQRGVRKGERALLDRGIRVLPANRDYMGRTFGGCRGEEILSEFLDSGYGYSVTESNRSVFEVYPFAILHLLTGGKVPRYKKGKAPERRRGMLEVLGLMGTLANIEGIGSLFERIEAARPGQMKSLADEVDALLCAACVYAHWQYGGKRTHLVGGGEEGWILLPRGDDDDQ
ncbi:MAG: DUF429 domain-containing protein [Methanomassiliicoccales archaeon]